jgi:hypothetical protein
MGLGLTIQAAKTKFDAVAEIGARIAMQALQGCRIARSLIAQAVGAMRKMGEQVSFGCQATFSRDRHWGRTWPKRRQILA